MLACQASIPILFKEIQMNVHLVPQDVTLELAELGEEIVADIAAGDAEKEEAERHYRCAGLNLVEAKKQAPNFEVFLDQHGIGKSRAYELIAIAEGRTTAKDIREKANARKKRHRKKTATTKPPVPKVSVPERTEQEPQDAEWTWRQFKGAVDKMDAATKIKARDYISETIPNSV
jgi:hypothetical protein